MIDTCPQCGQHYSAGHLCPENPSKPRVPTVIDKLIDDAIEKARQEGAKEAIASMIGRYMNESNFAKALQDRVLEVMRSPEVTELIKTSVVAALSAKSDRRW